MFRSHESAQPNYGIDAPSVVVRFVGIAIAALLAGLAAWAVLADSKPQLAAALLITGIITCVWFLINSGVMVLGSKVIKLRLRDRLLDALSLRGDENVLDVGCGRGLLLIGAARRLTTGRAVGIDLWQTDDQSGNHPDRTLANARAERVADRVQIQTADMRRLPFEEGIFDAVVSSWAIHNIYDAAGRTKAIEEMIRILKPGGKIVIVDIQHTSAYAQVLREHGMAKVERSGPNFLFVIPSHVVTAESPKT